WKKRRRRKKESETRTVRSNLLLPEPEVEKPRRGPLASNRLKTTKYTALSFLPKNLFEQFHRLANVYFVFIALLNFVPAVNAFQPELALAPVLFILAVTAIKDLWEDYSRYRSDNEINHMECLVYCRNEKKYVNRFWKEVEVGDFVQLRCNEIIPADILLLSSSDPDGLCHIETANLDGETNLKQRQVVRRFLELFTSVIECEKPNNDLSRFRGYIVHKSGKKDGLYKENLLLRGCTVRNTEEVTGIVIYAGHETKALLNNNGPRYKRSKLERQMNIDVLWCVLILIAMCLFSAIESHAVLYKFKNMYLPSLQSGTYFLLYIKIFWFFVLIPISLYVSIEIVKVCQVFFIHQDKDLYDEETDSQLQCRALNITEDLGQIQYIFSDKTGTLTENKMVFRRCTVSGVEYSHDANGKTEKFPPSWDVEAERLEFAFQQPATRSMRGAQLRAVCIRKALREKDITPDSNLLEKVNECARSLEFMRSHEQSLSQLTPELSDIFDFFIGLTICNTVVVTSPDQPRQKVGYRENIMEFEASFSSSSSLSTSKSMHRLGSNSLSTTSTESTLLKLEEKFAHSAQMNNNGYSSQQGRKAIGIRPEERELRYEAESPDEAALVYAARAYNCALVGRLSDQVSVELPHLGTLTFELLHTLGFDSIRKRMSVVVRHPLTDEINVYTKGADSVIMDLLLPWSVPDFDLICKHQKKIQSKTQNYLNLYAIDGLRTLCIAKRVLSKEEYACWLKSHLEAESSIENREELLFQSALRIETNLHLLGATGIEDRLQDGVPETIANLRKAGLQIWVLTGDKQETAINIAYACKLLDHDEEIITLNAESLVNRFLSAVGFGPLSPPSSSLHSTLGLVIDGKTLAYALDKTLEDKFLSLARRCRSVLCCRSTPLQKSMVVKLVRNKLKAMTLAIGDGANDVSMIQVADVGVGISGPEGMQAVMASDFAIPQFQHLEKLLLVHGHWCYSRLANMVLYFFYKNAMFVALLLWYQFYCGFSGSSMIDQWYLIFFNLLFSSLPQMITGVLDKDIPADVLIAVPQLYRSGQKMEEYQPHMFWMNMIDALYQSLVCFFIPYFTYYDSDVDIFSWGTPITTIALFTIILHLAIETKTWTLFHWSSCIFSILLFFIVALVYNVSCPICYPPSNPYWTMEKLMGEPMFYLTCLISPVTALLPRYSIFHCLQLGRQLTRLPPETRSQNLDRLNIKKESIPQQPPCAEHSPQNPQSKIRNCSKVCNQNPTSQPFQHGNEPAFPTNTRAEHTTGLSVMASPPGALLCGENKHSSVANSEVQSPRIPHNTSEMESISVGEMFPWNSTIDQSGFSLLNWITSTPLFIRFGRVLQLSPSPLQNEVQDNMSVLGSISSLHQDFKGLTGQSSNDFQEKIKGTAADCCKTETFETTFL
uniref:Phospholipid-transporting ATPase n=1 Tax=Pelusios castaneus TaxID=367368 RepID=A0A8C8S1E2_9SAUR